MTDQAASEFSIIPVNILDPIFQNLYGSDLQNASLVCQMWYQEALPLLFRSLILNRRNIGPLLNVIKNRSASQWVRSIRFVSSSHEFRSKTDFGSLASSFLTECPQLVEVISMAMDLEPWFETLTSRNNWTSIRVLKLGNIADTMINQIFQVCPNLTTLRVGTINPDAGRPFRGITLPKGLIKFTHYNAYDVSEWLVITSFPNLFDAQDLNLTTLSLRFTDFISYFEVLSNLKKLRSLDVYIDVDSEDLKSFISFSQNPSLRLESVHTLLMDNLQIMIEDFAPFLRQVLYFTNNVQSLTINVERFLGPADSQLRRRVCGDILESLSSTFSQTFTIVSCKNYI